MSDVTFKRLLGAWSNSQVSVEVTSQTSLQVKDDLSQPSFTN